MNILIAVVGLAIVFLIVWIVILLATPAIDHNTPYDTELWPEKEVDESEDNR